MGEPSHSDLMRKVEVVHADLQNYKDEDREARDKTNKRLRVIEDKFSALSGGWKAILWLGSLIIGIAALLASIASLLHRN